ncbi:MAG TPA: PAS domain S-box protein [Kiritimatiellia bacterium]|nr:PAS domain S-box protein [Kiritimatiellia bacterium]HMP34090.1 PAS domain S-box protein [Kiritimatiellia bacterium]
MTTPSDAGMLDLLAIYHGLFDTSPDPIYIEDEQGIVLDANRAACRFQGLTRDELVGCNVLALVPSSERDRLGRDFRRWFSGELTSYEGFTQRHDGTVVPVEVHGIRIDYRGRPAVILHVRDISALHRKRQEFALIFQHMTSGCALLEVIEPEGGLPDARILAVNQALLTMVGLSTDVSGQTLHEVFPSLEPYWMETFARVAATGEAVRMDHYNQVIDKHLEVSAYSPEPGKVVLLVYDNTERQKALQAIQDQQERERQVLAAQKLESLGILAGGIAHDFNNLLVGVLGNADLALHQLEADHPARDHVEQVRTAGKRASELTQLMLAYSGKARFNQGRVALVEIIRETHQLVALGISKKIAVHLHLDPTTPMVNGDITQIRQLVMNVITNASDAIGDQPGDITIRCARLDLTPSTFRPVADLPPIEPGPYVVFEVRDSGCGIEPDNIPRIFEPFYTSKFSGRGLGLAAVLGIVKSHRGSIELYSVSGRGTCFRFAFPVTPGDAHTVAVPETPGLAATTAASARTILIADDEPVVRQVLCHALRRAGYLVEEVVDGYAAVERLARGPVDLLLLDLTMPRLSGEETLHYLQRQHIHLPVLVMSGYAEAEAGERFLTDDVRGYIEKPFELASVLDKIRRVLANPASGT